MKLHSEMYKVPSQNHFPLSLLVEAVGEPAFANDQLFLLILSSPRAVFALVGWSEAIIQFNVNTLIPFILCHFGSSKEPKHEEEVMHEKELK